MYYWFFKIFNNIKSSHESEQLAKLELISLFGQVKPINNFFEVLSKHPLDKFTNDNVRIQDYVLYELPYGRIQGYWGVSDNINKIRDLVKRLAYTREIYLVGPKGIEQAIYEIWGRDKEKKIFQVFESDNLVCVRIITYQYFLEKSEYISKLSRNEQEIEANVQILFAHPFNNLYRIPASSTLSIGKRLEDYFAIREEPSLYLTHYFHPYKGKFHPKMARALLNYVYPDNAGIVMDNFAGSGTLLVEASLMELESIGIEINPLSVLMSNVKCESLLLDVSYLRDQIDAYFDKLEQAVYAYSLGREGIFNSGLQNNNDYIDLSRVEKNVGDLLSKIKGSRLKYKSYDAIYQIVISKVLANKVENAKVRRFLLLSISGAISDISRRTKEEFFVTLRKRVNDLYLRLYLFQKMNDVLDIKVGKSLTYERDTRDMRDIKDNYIDGIVNSPPYSTALDYIKNDYPQLVLLNLVDSMDELEKNMIGNPRMSFKRDLFSLNIKKYMNDLPNSAISIINTLSDNGRQKDGARLHKFFVDMKQTLKEMYRVLKPNRKCAIVIGNNHFKGENQYIEVSNDKIIIEMSQALGFNVDSVIERELEKSSEGNIRRESVVILRK